MRDLLPLLALACTPETKEVAEDSAPATDSAVVTDSACAPLDVTVESTSVNTVLRARWRTDAPSTGLVEFVTADGEAHVSPVTAEGTEHEMLLLGVPADTDLSITVRSSNATCEQSAATTGRTGSLPSGLYPTRATGTASWSGFEVIPLQGSGYAVVIIDNKGRYVWYHPFENYGNLMRAFLSSDRQHVVVCWAGPQNNLADGKIVKISLDGQDVQVIPFPDIDHDMVELPDGTIGAIVVEPQGGDLADTIVELAPDGRTREIFSAWDHWTRAGAGVPSNEPNWVHGNGLDYDPVEDVYYLSMKALRGLAKIDRATGDVIWVMNGLLNDFQHAGAPIQMHHQFDVLDGSIVFFENGEPSRAYSRAVEVAFDEASLTSSEVWSYTADPPLYVYAKGDVHRFPDDITQVVWSSAGQIQDVDAAGNVVWQLDLDFGLAMTFVQYVPSLYTGQE
jgi:hypothetical protein